MEAPSSGTTAAKLLCPCYTHCLISGPTPRAAAQVVSDLGLLTLKNAVKWQRHTQPADPASVLLDTAVLSLKGLGAVVDADGHRGGNIIQEYDEGLHVRPLRSQ